MKTAKKFRAILVSTCIIIALLAGATGVMAAKFQITDIDIPEQISLEQGAALALNVAYTVEGDLSESILQKAAKAVPLSWSSSDTAVATVDNHGKVTAVGPGTAEISVTGQNGALSDICSVTVTVTPETLTIPNEITLTLNHFNAQDLGAALLPENTTAKVCYESSDESVATASTTGEVIAIGRGECIIRAWAADTITGATYDLQSETKVFVQTAPAKLSLSNATLQPGATKHLTVSTEPAEVDMGTDFTWTSSDESIAVVDETGFVTAKAAGTATITVSNELGQSASCNVTITSCTYCGAAEHTTYYCAKKAAEERGAVGRWSIPSVGLDVAVFASNSQSVCDASDSACFYNLGNTRVIADHKHQGFNAIKNCSVGASAYLDTGNGVQKYVCTKKEIGTNNLELLSTGYYGNILRYSDGSVVQSAKRGGLICYTCNHHWSSVTIVTFEPSY